MSLDTPPRPGEVLSACVPVSHSNLSAERIRELSVDLYPRDTNITRTVLMFFVCLFFGFCCAFFALKQFMKPEYFEMLGKEIFPNKVMAPKL